MPARDRDKKLLFPTLVINSVLGECTDTEIETLKHRTKETSFVILSPVDDGVGQSDPGVLEGRDGELHARLVRVDGGPHRHHALVVLHPPVLVCHWALVVLRGAG